MASSIRLHMCTCVRVYACLSHTRTQTQMLSPAPALANISLYVHLMCIFLPLSHSLFSHSLSHGYTNTHTHTHTHTHRQMLPPPGVPPSSAWYLANSFIGPGARLSDHNVMWMLISADVVQFGMGDAIAPHLWLHWSQVIVQYTFMGLILNHIVGSYWPTRAINLACDADFYWNVNTASRCCAENGGDTERKRVMWLHASHEITY